MYYYNSETKQSSWEKPDDLKSPVEVLDIILICTLNYTSQVYDVFFYFSLWYTSTISFQFTDSLSDRSIKLLVTFEVKSVKLVSSHV